MASGGSMDSQYSEMSGLGNSCTEFNCQPCHDLGTVREAVGLCVDCQDYLCRRCYDSHTIPKPSRTHSLLDKQQMLQPPTTPALLRQDKSTEPCPHHENQLIEYYCTDHSQLCCSVCLNLNHRTCEEALFIPSIAKDLASCEEYVQAENELREVLEKTRNISEDVKKSAATLETSFTESMTVVKQFRNVMNSMANKVEGSLSEEAEELKAVDLKQLTAITERYQRAQAELEATWANIDALQKSGYTCSMFIEIMKSQNKTKTLEAQIETAKKDHFYRKRRIQFSANPSILEQMQELEVFGKLSEIGTAVRAEYNGDIVVRIGADRYGCSITGTVTLPDGRIVLTDHANGNIKVVDVRNGHYITRKKLTSIPWDVAIIDSTQVVVTMPFAKQLIFVSVAVPAKDMKSGCFTNGIHITGTFDVTGNCYGIDFRDDLLAVSFCEPNEVQVINLKGVILYSISTDDMGFDIFNYPLYLTIGLDNASLYVSNNLSKSVTCVNFDGTVIASYTDDQLVDPRSVTLDCSGDIYVCAYGSNVIHHITPDCKKIRELMTYMDGLNSPLSINYCGAENRLYVGMSDTVRVYQILLGH